MFDMDGLLLDTERLILAAFVDARRQFSLPDREDIFLRCIGHRRDASQKIIRDSLEGEVSYEDFDRAWEQRIQERLAGDIPERPGASTLLKLLNAKGLTVGVATSTRTEHATEQLGRTGLLPHIRLIVGGDQVQKPKPDPEIYHLLAARLGTTASECVAFEDSNAGTTAAVASGAKVVQVPDLVTPTPDVVAFGHIIAPSLLEGAVLAGLIERSELSAV